MAKGMDDISLGWLCLKLRQSSNYDYGVRKLELLAGEGTVPSRFILGGG
jgi:hypothetical protein